MYRAKEQGRDGVEFASAAPAPKAVAPTHFVQLNWRSAYQCGHPLIDAQHQGLVDTANRLLGAILTENGKDEVARLIDLLLQDVVQHFKDEESLISAAGFPGAAEHALIHRELVDTALELAARFRSGGLGVGEIFKFLAQDVVARHMLNQDRKFFPYLDTLH